MKTTIIMISLLLMFLDYSWGINQYQYNYRNELISCDYGNGYVISYSYDSNGNLTNQTVSIPNVSPLSPTQFRITSNGNSKTLAWEPVTSNVNGTPIIISSYTIEASDNPFSGFISIGSTIQNQYTDTSDNHQKRFYRIRAVIGTREDVASDLQILRSQNQTIGDRK